MRLILPFLLTVPVMLGLPAFAALPESPVASTRNLTHILRSGDGPPKVRGSAAQTAPPVPANQAGARAHAQPYRPAKAGEGEPKG